MSVKREVTANQSPNKEVTFMSKRREVSVHSTVGRIARQVSLDHQTAGLQYDEHPASFAPRRGRSRTRAIDRVEGRNRLGLRSVSRFGVADSVAPVPHRLLLDRLGGHGEIDGLTQIWITT